MLDCSLYQPQHLVSLRVGIVTMLRNFQVTGNEYSKILLSGDYIQLMYCILLSVGHGGTLALGSWSGHAWDLLKRSDTSLRND